MLSKKPAYQPDDHGSGSHIVKKLGQKQWQSASLDLDQPTVYSHNHWSLSAGHSILENDQSNAFSESDLIGQDLWKQLKGSLFQCFRETKECMKIGKQPL